MKKGKTLIGGYSLAVLTQPRLGLLPAADKAAVPSHFTSGTKVEFSEEISEHPLVTSRARAGSPRGTVHWKTSPTTPPFTIRTSRQTGFRKWPTFTPVNFTRICELTSYWATHPYLIQSGVFIPCGALSLSCATQYACALEGNKAR